MPKVRFDYAPGDIVYLAKLGNSGYTTVHGVVQELTVTGEGRFARIAGIGVLPAERCYSNKETVQYAVMELNARMESEAIIHERQKLVYS